MTDKDVAIHERLAVLESEIAHIQKDASERYDHLKNVETKLDTLNLELQQYRGMVGAVLLVVTAIGTFVKLFWHDVIKFFK